MFDKFRIKITILATLIVTAYCFFNNINFLRTGCIIIFTIVCFYFLASMAELELKSYFEKKELLFQKEEQALEEDEDENSDLDNIQQEQEDLTII